MKKLTQQELTALGLTLERAIKHQQLQLGVWVMEKVRGEVQPIQTFATTELYGTASNEDSVELIVPPAALKWLWVRYAGYLGGAKKAANRKKRKAR
jgi:hypothetical protein